MSVAPSPQPVATRSFVQERSAVYLELTKPRITAMVMLTVAAGFFLAAPIASVDPIALVNVLVGTLLSCSGAGALNQYLERDTDGAMNRTQFRPLPQHKVSPTAVLAVGSALSIAGVAYLALSVNTLTAAIDALTLGSYLFVYTPMKRLSPFSTLIGAVPGALPPLMGWTAATAAVGAGGLSLFAILFLWQIPHFLAIGTMYQEDYDNAGFPLLASNTAARGRQMSLYAAALIPVSLWPALLGLAGSLYFWSAAVLGVLFLAFCVAAQRQASRKAARRVLLASVAYLPLLFASIFIDRMAA